MNFFFPTRRRAPAVVAQVWFVLAVLSKLPACPGLKIGGSTQDQKLEGLPWTKNWRVSPGPKTGGSTQDQKLERVPADLSWSQRVSFEMSLGGPALPYKRTTLAQPSLKTTRPDLFVLLLLLWSFRFFLVFSSSVLVLLWLLSAAAVFGFGFLSSRSAAPWIATVKEANLAQKAF